MPFTDEDRILIKMLRLEKGYNAWKLMSEFPGKRWKKPSLNRLLVKIDSTGSVARKKGSGRCRTARSVENVERVDDMVLSQEDAPGTHRTIRQIASEANIQKSSVHPIIKKDLQLKCFKKSKAQDLTATNKLRRLVRAKLAQTVS